MLVAAAALAVPAAPAAWYAARPAQAVAHASARPAIHSLRTLKRSDLPSVLHLVDRSRRIALPGGRRVPRPVTTYLWYPPRSSSGPRPLVVFGHGFASTPFVYRRLLRAWARAGYLVAAPLFPLGNAHAPGGPDEDDIVNQPRDMSFVISRLLAESRSAASPLHGLVDPSRIAVAGQSDGAMTAFAAAYERPWRDRRVRAALILSGAELGRRTALAPHAAPLLAVQGTADGVNEPVYSLRLFHAIDRPKFLLLIERAGHLPPYTVPGSSLALVERVSIAFLDRYLRGGSLQAISRAAGRFPAAELTSDP